MLQSATDTQTVKIFKLGIICDDSRWPQQREQWHVTYWWILQHSTLICSRIKEKCEGKEQSELKIAFSMLYTSLSCENLSGIPEYDWPAHGGPLPFRHPMISEWPLISAGPGPLVSRRPVHRPKKLPKGMFKRRKILDPYGGHFERYLSESKGSFVTAENKSEGNLPTRTKSLRFLLQFGFEQEKWSQIHHGMCSCWSAMCCGKSKHQCMKIREWS